MMERPWREYRPAFIAGRIESLLKREDRFLSVPQIERHLLRDGYAFGEELVEELARMVHSRLLAQMFWECLPNDSVYGLITWVDLKSGILVLVDDDHSPIGIGRRMCGAALLTGWQQRIATDNPTSKKRT